MMPKRKRGLSVTIYPLLTMIEIYKSIYYKSDTFKFFLEQFYKFYPCILCGTIHELHIQARPTRLIRCHQTYKNIPITIFSIICYKEKKAQRQYTKRILPPFVLPECNITLENDYKMLEEMPDTLSDIDRACAILGTYYEKTVRRHYHLITWLIQQTSIHTTNWLAQHPGIARQPDFFPYYSILKFYQVVFSELIIAQEKLYGAGGVELPAILIAGAVSFFLRSRKPLISPLNLSSLLKWYFDTS
jgi:hypothetical protein